jgi:hypothetical protein
MDNQVSESVIEQSAIEEFLEVIYDRGWRVVNADGFQVEETALIDLWKEKTEQKLTK